MAGAQVRLQAVDGAGIDRVNRGEANGSRQEGGHGFFVRGVEHGRAAGRRAQAIPSQVQAGKLAAFWRVETQRLELQEVQAWRAGLDALGQARP